MVVSIHFHECTKQHKKLMTLSFLLLGVLGWWSYWRSLLWLHDALGFCTFYILAKYVKQTGYIVEKYVS